MFGRVGEKLPARNGQHFPRARASPLVRTAARGSLPAGGPSAETSDLSVKGRLLPALPGFQLSLVVVPPVPHKPSRCPRALSPGAQRLAVPRLGVRLACLSVVRHRQMFGGTGASYKVSSGRCTRLSEGLPDSLHDHAFLQGEAYCAHENTETSAVFVNQSINHLEIVGGSWVCFHVRCME